MRYNAQSVQDINQQLESGIVSGQCAAKLEELLADGPMSPVLFAERLDREVLPLVNAKMQLLWFGPLFKYIQNATQENNQDWFRESSRPSDADGLKAHLFNESLCQRLMCQYASCCRSQVSNFEHSPYLRYQIIVNKLDELKELFVEKHQESPTMYSLFMALCEQLRRKQLDYRELIFGKEFVNFVMTQLAGRDKDKNSYKKCPSCRTVWWDDSGCQQRRCGHQGAPDWNLEHIEVPRRGKCAKQSGCGRKFEWNFGEPLNDMEFSAFWAVHRTEIPLSNETFLNQMKRLHGKVARSRSRSPRRSDRIAHMAGVDSVQVKHEAADEPVVIHEIPTSTGWHVELNYMPTTRGRVITTFTESQSHSSEPRCFLSETCFLRTDGTMVDVRHLQVADQLQGPAGEVIVDSLFPLRKELRSIVNIKVLQGSFTVTDDHRMCLPDGIFRAARELHENDVVSTTEGEQPIVDIRTSTASVPVFAICFFEDRAVFMGMSMERDKPKEREGAWVAAFGTEYHMDENQYMHFKFKGAICKGTESRFSAENCLEQLGRGATHFAKFGLRFMATDPYSVWVPRECADGFYEQVKQLLKSHAPSGSRIRKHHAHSSSPTPPDGIETPPPLTP